MPGLKIMPKNKTASTTDLVLDKFSLESDKNLKRFTTGCLGLGLLFGIYLTLRELDFIPPLIPEKKHVLTAMVIPEIQRYAKKLAEPVKRLKPPPGQSGKGNPLAETGKMKVDRLFSYTERSYDIIERVIKNQVRDLDKTFENTGRLSQSKTRIGSGRRGKSDSKWNDLYSDVNGIGPGDIFGDGDSRKPGFTPVQIDVNKPPPQAGTFTGFRDAPSRRSVASIMQVVRSHMPGLRHIYNHHLRKSPGFAGTLKLLFEISPSGRVVMVKLMKSTTGLSSFDNEIRQKVMVWKFEPIGGKGNDKVIIPLSFSE